MKIIDEILPKVKAEVRLDKDNKTLWIKTDTLDGYGRVIIEDGSNWCRVFYEDEDEPQTELVNDSPILVKDLVDDEFNPYDEECMRCKHLKLKCEFIPTYCKFEPKDEPQTEYKKWEMPKADKPTEVTTCVQVPACMLEDEPQTDCP